ncbi:hypothetical protein [Neisseria dentiae]|uniref:hypothetical protein n=3 Tax=Neisseria dentiae TaxID=194197 RepID=UPI0035A1D1BC
MPSCLTESQIVELSDRICASLISQAAHALATSSLDEIGEITLRDSLILAVSAFSSSIRLAVIQDREYTPDGWEDSAIDLAILRKNTQQREEFIGGVELKWWRRSDTQNAANRRRDIVKDLIRTATLYSQVTDFAFMALLTTDVSWEKTIGKKSPDRKVMDKLTASAVEKWKIEEIQHTPCVSSAINYLKPKVSIPNIFHTKLLSSLELKFASGRSASAKIWLVKKPQKSYWLS